MAKCTISGTLITGSEELVVGAVVYAAPAIDGYSSLITSTGEYRFVALDPVRAVTNASGNFSLSLVSGFSYRVVIRVIGLDEVITVPFSTQEVSLFSLLGLSGTTTTVTSTGEVPHQW